MYSIKAVRVLRSKSSKETAQALDISDEKYRCKEKDPGMFTIDECRKLIRFLDINVLEFTEIFNFEPLSEPHLVNKNIPKFTQIEYHSNTD